MFDDLLQGGHRSALGLEGFEPFGVLDQQVELQTGIGGIILGAAAGECFAILGQGLGVDGEQDDPVVLAQGGDQGSFVELEAYRGGLAIESALQAERPVLDGLGVMANDGLFIVIGICGPQTDIVLRVGPVNANERGKSGIGCVFHLSPPNEYSIEKGHASLSSAKTL